MTIIENYFETLDPNTRAEFERIRRLAYSLMPDATEGLSYAMPAYMYKGKAVLAAVKNKQFLSLYPYSGKVISALAEELVGFETTTGSIHFSLEQPLSDELLSAVIRLRMAEIDRLT